TTLLVEAGAGSGKTALMAGRVALLLAEGVRPLNIAAITFTEAAASELLSRISNFVEELLTNPRPPLQLAGALQSGITPEQRANLQEAREQLDDLSCTTIHGFCQQLIKPYPVETRTDPGARVVTAEAAELLFTEALEGWLREQLAGGGEGYVVELVRAEPATAVSQLEDIV